MIEKFIENIKYVSLPEKVIIYHLYNILNGSTSTINKRELQQCFNNVFVENERGKSAAKVEFVKQEFIKLMELNSECLKLNASFQLKKILCY